MVVTCTYVPTMSLGSYWQLMGAGSGVHMCIHTYVHACIYVCACNSEDNALGVRRSWERKQGMDMIKKHCTHPWDLQRIKYKVKQQTNKQNISSTNQQNKETNCSILIQWNVIHLKNSNMCEFSAGNQTP